MVPEFYKFELPKNTAETPEGEEAAILRADISNILSLKVIKTKNDTFDLDDLKSGSPILSEYIDDVSREEIKASIGQTIYDLALGDTGGIEDILASMRGIDRSVMPDFSGIVVVLFSRSDIDISRKIMVFNRLQQASKNSINIKPEVMDELFKSGPLKSLIDNKSITKKMANFLDEISSQELYQLVNYRFSDEKDDENKKVFADFNKDQKYSIDFNEGKWPIQHMESGVESKELRDFVINDVWEYWKRERKLPFEHVLELNEKGKVVEFMLTELFDAYKAFGAKNIFPTSKVDDDRVEGAHCDFVVQMDNSNIGVDIFYTLDENSINKKFRNFIDHNPRYVVNWPVKERGQSQDQKKMIVLPIAVNEDVVIKMFAKYYESYKTHASLGASFEEFRNSEQPRTFPGFKHEVRTLLNEFSRYIKMFRKDDPNKDIIIQKIDEVSDKFTGYSSINSIAKAGSSKESFKYIESWYHKHNRNNSN